MNQQIEKFNPAKEEIQAAVMEVKGLTINGVDDVAGYEAVKAGKKKLAEYRKEITKFGKKQREEAIFWQREVLRQEKELIEMIEPTETKLKNALEAVDKERKRKEREVLLPARKQMLAEIECEMADSDILDLDEKAFSVVYGEKKVAYLEAQNRKMREAEEAKQRKEELERAKEEAAKQATEEAERKAKEELERVEKEKQAEIDKIKRDQEEAERQRLEDEQIRLDQIEADKREEAREQRLKEKNLRYKTWLKENGCTEENKTEFHIIRDGDTFTLYKKVSTVII